MMLDGPFPRGRWADGDRADFRAWRAEQRRCQRRRRNIGLDCQQLPRKRNDGWLSRVFKSVLDEPGIEQL
jgi:hypothetical protein